MKELKISPVPEDSTFSKIYAHMLLLWPFAPIIFAGIAFFFIGEEIRKQFIEMFMKEKEFLLFIIIVWFIATLNMVRELFNHLIVEEICYIENKTFYYQKFRRVFGMRKLIKKLEIPLSEILEVKEGKKPFFLYFFLSPVSHRNSAEIITRDGKKYKIMNSVVFGNRSSLNPTSSETNARTKEIFSKVKEMIFKTKNTLNF
ncbi:hypothetical protein [Fusobacterium vincentii]|uniref:hypothetical protein n=1 Tax=Fusobacterium vincentii TaxID=155615 RepID=UPI0032442E61